MASATSSRRCGAQAPVGAGAARQIVTMLMGRGTDELERMLLGGVEIVARVGGGGGSGAEGEDHG